MLLGTHPGLRMARRMFRLVPASQRCKVCGSPHDGFGAPLVRLAGFGRYPRNPQLCNNCFRMGRRFPGGAEVEVTSLFADVRGSTALAEAMPAAEYSATVDAYVRVASRAVREPGGIVQKLLGDGVMALFLPALSGGNTALAAVSAGRRILREATLPIGVGLHTGEAWVGFVGGVDEVLDFTALGDPVNIASRLGSEASAGELLLSDATATAAGVDTRDLEARRLALRGRSEGLDAWSESVPPTAARA